MSVLILLHRGGVRVGVGVAIITPCWCACRCRCCYYYTVLVWRVGVGVLDVGERAAQDRV